MDLRTILVNRETVKQADAVSSWQVHLGAAARSMRRIPGAIATAIAVGKANLGIGPAIGGIEVPVGSARGWTLIAGPVVAGVIDTISEGGTVGLRAGQHFMSTGIGRCLGVIPKVVPRIGIVVQAGNGCTLFGKARELVEIVAEAR